MTKLDAEKILESYKRKNAEYLALKRARDMAKEIVLKLRPGTYGSRILMIKKSLVKEHIVRSFIRKEVVVA